MDDRLQNILTLDSVEGVVILSHTGEMLNRKGLDQYKSEMPELTKRLMRVITLYRNYKWPVKEIEIVWRDTRIIGIADEIFILLAFCRNNASFPLIRMTLNVSLAAIKADRKTQKMLKKMKNVKVNHLRTGDLDEWEINLISKLL